MFSNQSIRGTRYCEIFIVSGINNPVGTIYNTYGLNLCPEDCWSTLNPQNLVQYAKQAGIKEVRQAIMNGPRFWIMDSISSPAQPGPVVSLGCLQMRQVGQIPLTRQDLRTEKPPYQEQLIKRDTVYTFNANQPTYQLINPKGEAYIMQSYTTMVNQNLTLNDLNNLKSQLQFPQGWDYQVISYPNDVTLATVNGQAVILQDNLKNTYQKISTSQTNIPLNINNGTINTNGDSGYNSMVSYTNGNGLVFSGITDTSGQPINPSAHVVIHHIWY